MFNPVDTTEFKLMLSCCRVNPGSKELKLREEAFAEAINEEIFLTLLHRHRVYPIVYFNLKHESRLSLALKENLKALADGNQILALQARLMQFQLQKEFNQHQFKGFFLKGVSLAVRYYGDPGLRHARDIDVWVEQKAVEPVAKWLVEKGYVSEPDFQNFNAAELAFAQKTGHHYHFSTEKSELPSVVELHWMLRGPVIGFNLRPEQPMNEVDHFLYLCTHGTEHGWFRMKWLFDLPQIMDRIVFDWEEVRKRSIELDCLPHLEISMMILGELLNEPIPKEILSSLSPGKYSKQIRHIRKQIANEIVIDFDLVYYLENLIFLFSLSQKKINWPLILSYLTSQNDWKLVPLPKHLFFLYFLFRPFLFIWRRLFKRSVV